MPHDSLVHVYLTPNQLEDPGDFALVRDEAYELYTKDPAGRSAALGELVELADMVGGGTVSDAIMGEIETSGEQVDRAGIYAARLEAAHKLSDVVMDIEVDPSTYVVQGVKRRLQLGIDELATRRSRRVSERTKYGPAMNWTAHSAHWSNQVPREHPTRVA